MEKELFYRPNLLLLNHFASLLETNISRKEIYTIEKHSSIASLQDISNILHTLGIQSAYYKVSLSQVSKLALPFITVFEENKQKYFVVVENISEDFITFYLPNSGNHTASLSSVSNKWLGLILYPESIDIRINAENDSTEEGIRQYLANDVRLIDDFFSAEECQFIISYTEANNLFQKSPLANADGKIFYSDVRTSYTSIIKEKQDKTIQKIYNRVAMFLDVPESHIEYLECVRYSTGQQFRPHWDTYDNEDRTHTLLLYLNDDYEGGETYFPTLNFKAKPQRGRILYFRDRDIEQNIIPYSLHAGLPVTEGVKYACNIWVRNSPIPEKHYLETGVLA